MAWPRGEYFFLDQHLMRAAEMTFLLDTYRRANGLLRHDRIRAKAMYERVRAWHEGAMKARP